VSFFFPVSFSSTLLLLIFIDFYTLNFLSLSMNSSFVPDIEKANIPSEVDPALLQHTNVTANQPHRSLKRSIVVIAAGLLSLSAWIHSQPSSLVFDLGGQKVGAVNRVESTSLHQQRFQGQLVEGLHGAVAVETEECSDIGVGGKSVVSMNGLI
jgi:hypothetical protein